MQESDKYKKIAELLKEVSEKYHGTPDEEYGRNHILHKIIVTDLCNELNDIIADSRYFINGHDGIGKRAKVPWIGIHREEFGTSGQSGIYIAILFSAGGRFVYFSVQQGSENLNSKELIRRSSAIRKRFDFVHGEKMDLESSQPRVMKYLKADIVNSTMNREFISGDNVEKAIKTVIPALDMIVEEFGNIEEYENWISLTPSDKNLRLYDNHVNLSIADFKFRCIYDKDKIVFSRILPSLFARRFVISSGLSGSGKTLSGKMLALWLTDSKDDYALIPVGANWTSKDDLLGYPDALRPGKFVKRPALELLIRAHDNWRQTDGKEGVRPFFLILDEMNLSHVERYFSDFLSAMESGEEIELHDMTNPEQMPDEGDNLWDGVPARIKIPGNLFVIGTVNVDETTYMFSPKVLDRANVIEFRADKDAITAFLDGAKDVDLESIAGAGAEFGEAFVHTANMDTSLDEPYAGWLKKELDIIFEFLSDHEGEFGFRTARAITRFVQFSVMLRGNPEGQDAQRKLFIEAMDAQIMQKILPKMHGSKKKLGPVLRGLAELCARGDGSADDGAGIDKARNAANNKHGDGSLLKETPSDLMKKCREGGLPPSLRYPVSFRKIVRMLRILDRDGFASFAEA